MSDILIRGMEMPKEKSICVEIFADGGVHEFASPFLLGLAIELPEHGRLIDADALLSQYGGNIWTAQIDYAEGMRDIIKDIEAACTIIPASGGDEA